MTKDSLAYVIPPPPVPALPVLGANGLFPVTRIFCLGRNYADHAREMGGNPDREPPFFFMKPANALLPEGQDFPYPSQSENVHYEFELVVAIGAGGADIPKDAALSHVFGYAAGLDMTRRDLQQQAAKSSRPWEVGKAFDRSAPCSPVVPASRIGHPDKGGYLAGAEWQARADIGPLRADLERALKSSPNSPASSPLRQAI